MADVIETSEARWFKIVVFVISGFFVGFSIANIVYFNRIRRNNGAPGITRGEATAMLWINAILFGVSLIIFIWSIYRLVAGVEYRRRVTQYLQEPNEGFIEAPETGAPIPRARRSRTVTRQTTGIVDDPLVAPRPVRATTTTIRDERPVAPRRAPTRAPIRRRVTTTTRS